MVIRLIYRKAVLSLIAISLPLATTSCSSPNIKVINCKNSSIEGIYQDGTVSTTPKNALGEQEFTWQQDDKIVETKQFEGFSSDGKAKYNTQVVKAEQEGDVLTFSTAAYSIFPGKSFSLNTKTGAYSSQDLAYQDSPDGSFKIYVKGVCSL